MSRFLRFLVYGAISANFFVQAASTLNSSNLMKYYPGPALALFAINVLFALFLMLCSIYQARLLISARRNSGG